MQTANKPENNNNSHEAHPSLGKLDELRQVFEGWMKDNAKDFAQAETTEQHYVMKGRIQALRDVIGYLVPHN